MRAPRSWVWSNLFIHSRRAATGVYIAVSIAGAAGAWGCGGDDAPGATTAGDAFDNASDRSNDDDGDDTGGGGSGAAGPQAGDGNLFGSEACKHVDLVISVDASMTMQEELQAMRDVIFPAFARRLHTIGAGLDDWRAATLDACPMPASFHTRGAARECGFQSGSAWIEDSSSAMDAEFACVGDIFVGDQQCSGDNDDEQPASTIAAALEEPMISGPNAGFRRSDALVIAVAITDEDEQPTGDQRSPEEVYNRLVETVADDPRRMVFLGIGGARRCQGVYGMAEDSRTLRRVTDLFANNGRGVFWDLCEGRLEDGLERAFQVIERACEELPPCGELDEYCGGEGPPDQTPPFCVEFPDDVSCIVD